jgi:hypothetical protein
MRKYPPIGAPTPVLDRPPRAAREQMICVSHGLAGIH